MPYADPEQERAAARARYHRRKAADPDKVRAESVRSSLTYNKRNPEDPATVRLRVREWRVKNPDKVRATTRRRRARLKGQISNPEWEAVIELDPCAYCGVPGGTVDHIVPVSDGGSNDASNLTGSCALCNLRKANKGLISFLAR